jgi:hypothetical protein
MRLPGARSWVDDAQDRTVQPTARQEAEVSVRDIRAETLEETDLDAAWQRIEREAPEYPQYKTKTDREIAIGRLRGR